MSDAAIKQKRVRSPNYPAISLKEGIKRAKEFWDKEKRNAAPVRVAASIWGYQPKSSGGLTTIAAMISYGLMQDEGAKESRRIKLTETAQRIILETRESPSERDILIREAALKPRIYSQVLASFPDSQPSDDTLRHYLIFDLKFNDEAVSSFIRDFRETVEYAKLYDSVNISEDEGDKTEVDGDRNKLLNPISRLVEAPNRPKKPEVKPGMKQEVFTLSEGDVVLQWPDRLSLESLEDFEDWWKIMLRKVKRAAAKKYDPKLDEAETA